MRTDAAKYNFTVYLQEAIFSHILLAAVNFIKSTFQNRLIMVKIIISIYLTTSTRIVIMDPSYQLLNYGIGWYIFVLHAYCLYLYLALMELFNNE
jgi:hypothetical protein